jgi:hypothetical protein
LRVFEGFLTFLSTFFFIFTLPYRIVAPEQRVKRKVVQQKRKQFGEI